jgi:hypothetical protein
VNFGSRRVAGSEPRADCLPCVLVTCFEIPSGRIMVRTSTHLGAAIALTTTSADESYNCGRLWEPAATTCGCLCEQSWFHEHP